MIGGLAESRYLSMDKLKTRGVLLANKNVSIAEGIVYNEGNLSVRLLLFLPFINMITTIRQCILLAREPRETN